MGVQLQPIRNLDVVFEVARKLRALETDQGKRMYMLWIVGINMGMRIGDIVDLRVGDLRGKTEYTYLPHKQEHKNRSRKITIPIPDDVRQAVEERCQGKPDDAWLFPSRKTHPTRGEKYPKPRKPEEKAKHRERAVNVGAISRQTARRDIKEIGRVCGLDMRIGCHTMRKTFGYHYYQETHDVAQLQEWFYHESPATTLVYIGISLDNFKDMVRRSPFRGIAGEEK